ncbi:NAD(P)H-quinone oxidoreductase [Dyadobacter sp. CY312]|uniref:NAD(P)H-quinone oxidoreductase n=1 Tax=Dyadobacter sp. CY312 TaxID=2907303 RepID=UPI001F2F8DD7|nr:NAD(P)H-quinone oxidoreductase [Dyadobacter sp. CY312]MCE7041058.1 NAD(P)H-quinone oxidoreductase [Dyadobacter sp. CY312]
MKAVVITKPGGADVLQLQPRAIPQPGANEVLIKVQAAGINRPDVLQRKGQYPAPANAPQDIPGLEVAGIIESCGNAVTRWQNGDAVCALLTGGGYAEYAVAQSSQCLPVPQGFSFAEAASLPETIFTVWHNVFRLGKLQPGKNFLVHGGSSGIGITAIQLARAFGAKAFATAGTDEKCEACISLGAGKCINYKIQDFEAELKSEGIDVILDMVGGNYIAKNIRLLREDGRLVFINTMKGSKPDPADLPDFGLVMRKRLTISGSTLRNRDTEFKQLLTEEILVHVWPKIESGAFKPVIFKEFPMREASMAHKLMESSDHIGKIVLTNNWWS